MLPPAAAADLGKFRRLKRQLDVFGVLVTRTLVTRKGGQWPAMDWRR
jgi:hypothetical protein